MSVDFECGWQGRSKQGLKVSGHSLPFFAGAIVCECCLL